LPGVRKPGGSRLAKRLKSFVRNDDPAGDRCADRDKLIGSAHGEHIPGQQDVMASEGEGVGDSLGDVLVDQESHPSRAGSHS
jgi:hypothetical protein